METLISWIVSNTTVATIGLTVTIVGAFSAWRSARKRQRYVRIDSVSTGTTNSGMLYWNTVTSFVVNEGDYAASLLNYSVEIYENRFKLLISKIFWQLPYMGKLSWPTRIVRGDGWILKEVNGQVLTALPDGASPPFPMEAGHPKRLDVYDHAIWPDRRWRRVYFVTRSSPGSTIKRKLVPAERHSYLDNEGKKQLLGQHKAAIENTVKLSTT